MKITEHFTWEEFTRSETAEKLHIDNTIPEGLKPRIRVLCEQVLEPLRAHFGPIKVTSGYRCEALNARVGGAKNSQHTKGEAADIVPLCHPEGTEGSHASGSQKVTDTQLRHEILHSVQNDRLGAQDDRQGARNDKNSGNSLKMMFLWMMENLEFDQLILEPGWIHVSYREGHNRQQVLYL